MSVSALPADRALPRAAERRREAVTLDKAFSWVLQDFASLQLTVILFLLAMFVIWVGTTAQADADIWEVVDRYFRSFFMEVSFKYVFPAQFFPAFLNALPGKFYAPGGMCVGLMMMMNLLAAHLWRFKVQASGTRLIAGLGMTAFGVLITFLVIASGHNSQGLQGVPLFSWGQMWIGLLFLYMAGVIGGGAALASWAPTVWNFEKGTQQQRIIFGLSTLVLVILAALWCFLIYTGIRIPDEGLRIVWQLMMGILGTIPLLAGCIMVFKQRGGIVVIHAGIALMMFGELFVSLYAVENQARIAEGQTTNYVHDIRNTELAITRQLGDGQEEVFVIPRSKLLESAASKTPIQDDRLPFEVQVIDYYANATLRRAKSKDKLPYTKGAAFDAKIALQDLPASKGTDSDTPADEGAMYAKFLEKGSGKDLGTYALSQKVTGFVSFDPPDSKRGFLEPFEDQVAVGKQKYGVSLRFQRSYRPYSLRLMDARGDKFAASQITKNFSSDVHLVDPTRNTSRSVHIWMNNPLRFAGETFYQSSFGPLSDSKDFTVLSVVTNTGWMIPYVACMIVAIGLLAHFTGTLARFLKKTLESDREALIAEVVAEPVAPIQAPGKRGRNQPAPATLPVHATPYWRTLNIILSGIAVGFASLIFIIWLFIWLAPPKFKKSEMNLSAFARLPVLDDGRVKPMDTLARNSARVISGSYFERVKDQKGKRIQAVEWLLDTITASPEAKHYKLFKIESPEVVKTLGMEERPGDWCYSLDEIGGMPLAVASGLESPEDIEALSREYERSKFGAFMKESDAAAQLRRQRKPVSDYQTQLLKLADRLEQYRKLVSAFKPMGLPPFPSGDELETNRNRAFAAWQAEVQQRVDAVYRENPVRPIAHAASAEETPSPVKRDAVGFQPYAVELFDLQFQTAAGQEPNPVIRSYYLMLESYRTGDATEFNASLAKYQASLSKNPPQDYFAFKANLEAWFNGMSPFFMGMFPYFLAFLIAIVAIPVWILVPQLRMPLNWTAFALIVLTLSIHTLALALRVYISGRPPVTTLYSSAIFIGWAGVIFGVFIELIYRLGIGNLIASVSGFATLFVAYLLAQDGETMPQLAAVLDTQFWLATHVVCITLGYAATFAAGLAAISYVLIELGRFGYDVAHRGLKQTALKPLADALPAVPPPGGASKAMGMIVYGIVCFALLFSFVGTVLGGLWADDSWGRFWGWDPKENGALLIVLWNAVVLHARWGGLVKDRGLAILAIGGNIVTAWSWFGVNQLGIGLHSYGFNKELVQMLCALVVVHLGIIFVGGLGLLPTKWWWSYAAEQKPEKAPA
jgi:ABC-type transport system involved in cytochrome c biogenesis permease subunit